MPGGGDVSTDSAPLTASATPSADRPFYSAKRKRHGMKPGTEQMRADSGVAGLQLSRLPASLAGLRKAECPDRTASPAGALGFISSGAVT